MKRASGKFYRIAFCLVLLAMCMPGIFAAESSDVITQESQFFTVGYALAEREDTDYWMVWNSKDQAKSADVPDDDALIMEQFRNAVDICVLYEDRFNQGIGTLAAGFFSPLIWAVTLPDVFESWEQAAAAAERADACFLEIA